MIVGVVVLPSYCCWLCDWRRCVALCQATCSIFFFISPYVSCLNGLLWVRWGEVGWMMERRYSIALCIGEEGKDSG